MKKIVFVIIICLNIYWNIDIAFAADVLYSVCYSLGDQDALIVGKVVNADPDEDSIEVEIIRLISGELKEENKSILVVCKNIKKQFNINDEVLLSIENVSGDVLYNLAYNHACYTVKVMNNDKIELLQNNSFDYDYREFDYFDIILQWFCNTGEILSEDDTENGNLYYRGDGEHRELVYSEKEHKWYQDALSSKFNEPNILYNEKTKLTELMVIFLGVSVIVVSFYCWRRKQKVNYSQH